MTNEPKDNIQIPPVKEKLTRLLGELVPEVHDELQATFEDEFPLNGDGTSVCAVSDLQLDF